MISRGGRQGVGTRENKGGRWAGGGREVGGDGMGCRRQEKNEGH